MTKHGFFVGRLNPIHLGHEQIIDHMIKTCGIDNCTIIIGSSNAQTTLRHFFSYSERRDFIRKLYPDMQLLGLPDYPSDEEWLVALYDIIDSISGTSEPGAIQFFGGADDDVQFFTDAGHDVSILNRFDGTTPVISATQVRDNLVTDASLNGLLNPKISGSVQKLFKTRWEEFKKV